MVNEIALLEDLFVRWKGVAPDRIAPMPGSGSYRKYYRIFSQGFSVLGVYNKDYKENQAFLSFTESLMQSSIPVPVILTHDLSQDVYLIEDLGDSTLFGLLEEQRQAGDPFSSEIVVLYKKVLSWLPHIQIKGGLSIHFEDCYPRSAFDRQSMMWDLSYFKYYFLKLAKISFDEQALEDDFSTLIDFLLDAEHEYFMYRDFQSRNIMIKDGQPWFIDYQGGRKGALQYDVASLLYDAKARIPEVLRTELLTHYLEELTQIHTFDRQRFLEGYSGYVLIRIMQAMGAYGFRGYYENKPHFLQSIPFALENLKGILEKGDLPIEVPTLMSIFWQMINDPRFAKPTVEESSLTISISSFSYKVEIPSDPSSNGGGFVFDCRALPNPGKFDQFKHLSGRDQPVIDFLKQEPMVDEFLNHAMALVDQSVKRYMERGFDHLMVSFGCTGGQHRSVYCAEHMAKHLKQNFPVKVNLVHTQQSAW